LDFYLFLFYSFSIKENLRKSFAQSANNFKKNVDSISQVLSKLDGELDVQLETVKGLSAKLGSLENSLSDIEEIDARCREANIEENDYTVFSVDDLKFELELIKQSVNKKSAFIENQVIMILIICIFKHHLLYSFAKKNNFLSKDGIKEYDKFNTSAIRRIRKYFPTFR